MLDQTLEAGVLSDRAVWMWLLYLFAVLLLRDPASPMAGHNGYDFSYIAMLPLLLSSGAEPRLCW